MANRTYQLEIQGILLSSYRETVLHFQSTNTADGDTVAAGESLNNGFASSLLALWLATLPSSYSLIRTAARRVALKPSAGTCKYYLQGSQPGTRGSQATAQQMCPSIFLIPTMGVKSGGKIFWPAVPQGDYTNNFPSAGWKSAVDAFIAAAVAGFTNSGMTWTLAIFSRKNGTTSNVAGHTFSPVVGYQSKRRKPVGGI